MSDLSFAGDLAISAHFGTPQSGASVRVRVKWFNVEKGFGFVTPLNGQPEAFLHAVVLSRGGLPHPIEGTELLCEIICGPKGPQVVRIIETLAPPVQPEPVPDSSGTVKWYQPDKGFGFVTADDGGRDIFLHKSALKRSNLDSLMAGQMVLMAVIESAKGREVRSLILL